MNEETGDGLDVWGIFSKTYKVKCPDGRVVFVHKNIDDAFPFSLSQVEAKSEIKSMIPEAMEATVGVEYRQGVDRILYAIDDLNSSIMMDFRASYVAYMTDPCSRGDYLERAVERIRQDRNDLIRLRMQASTLINLIRTAPAESEQIVRLYRQLLGALRVEDDVADAVAAIQDARSDAEAMTGDGSAG